MAAEAVGGLRNTVRGAVFQQEGEILVGVEQGRVGLTAGEDLLNIGPQPLGNGEGIAHGIHAEGAYSLLFALGKNGFGGRWIKQVVAQHKYVEAVIGQSHFQHLMAGIGVSHNIGYASMKGIICAINRDQKDTMRDDTMPGIFDKC